MASGGKYLKNDSPSEHHGYSVTVYSIQAYSAGLATVATPTVLYRMTPVSSQKKFLWPVTPTTAGVPFIV
jgi:hypothetical protein